MRISTASVAFLSALLAMMLVTGGAQAQTGSGYDLTWYTIDGGGGVASDAGSGYTLMGTVGQPEVESALTGGGYVLTGGFWSGASTAGFKVYLPLVLRNF